MNHKAYHGAVPATFIVVLVAFFTAIIFVNPITALAATKAKAKAPAAARLSAVEHTEARIKALQDVLKITDDQKELWNNLTRVMRENAKSMDALTKEKEQLPKTMNAVEHLKQHNQMTATRLEHMTKLIPPFEALYNSMSDEQKKSTDTIFMTGKHGKRKFN